MMNSFPNLLKHLSNNFMAKKKIKTIKERIEEIFVDFKVPTEEAGVKGKFMNTIMELIERAKSPALFCDKCESKMSIDLENGKLDCFNCGATKKLNLINDTTSVGADLKALKINPAIPNTKKPNPKLLEKIDELDDSKEPQKNKKPNKQGKSIQELANSRGITEPTEEDKAQLKKIPGVNANNINWVK